MAEKILGIWEAVYTAFIYLVKRFLFGWWLVQKQLLEIDERAEEINRKLNILLKEHEERRTVYEALLTKHECETCQEILSVPITAIKK
jgi:hypothetical protein